MIKTYCTAPRTLRVKGKIEGFTLFLYTDYDFPHSNEFHFVRHTHKRFLIASYVYVSLLPQLRLHVTYVDNEQPEIWVASWHVIMSSTFHEMETRITVRVPKVCFSLNCLPSIKSQNTNHCHKVRTSKICLRHIPRHFQMYKRIKDVIEWLCLAMTKSRKEVHCKYF